MKITNSTTFKHEICKLSLIHLFKFKLCFHLCYFKIPAYYLFIYTYQTNAKVTLSVWNISPVAFCQTTVDQQYYFWKYPSNDKLLINENRFSAYFRLATLKIEFRISTCQIFTLAIVLLVFQNINKIMSKNLIEILRKIDF